MLELETRELKLKEYEVIDATGSAVSIIAESFEKVGSDAHFHIEGSLVSIVEGAQKKPRRVK